MHPACLRLPVVTPPPPLASERGPSTGRPKVDNPRGTAAAVMSISRFARPITSSHSWRNLEPRASGSTTIFPWPRYLLCCGVSWFISGTAADSVLSILCAIPPEYMASIVESEVVHAVMNRIEDDKVSSLGKDTQIGPLGGITVRRGK